MEDWGVWEVVPVERCWRVTGKGPLGGRWVDVNKGDTQRPNVRCRYVAKDIAFKKSDDFFAAMPPLEVLRMLISQAATGRTSGRGGKKILVIDAKKAHLHAVPDREIFVDLPPERRQPGMCGRLKRCLYGTRDAPARWEAFLAAELVGMGFIQGRASACCYRHATLDVQAMVHGDDFVFVATDADLDTIEGLMKKSFLTKVVGRLGDGPKDVQEIRILNRVLRWTENGYEYEADQRHAEILARDFGHGAAVGTTGAKISTTSPSRRREATGEEQRERTT